LAVPVQSKAAPRSTTQGLKGRRKPAPWCAICPIDRRVASSEFAAVPGRLRDKNPCDGNKIDVLPPQNEKRLSLSIVADNVLALRQPAKPCKKSESCAGSWQSPADGPNDVIPF
jgi:hypothetical protein